MSKNIWMNILKYSKMHEQINGGEDRIGIVSVKEAGWQKRDRERGER